MQNEIIINATAGETRVAILERGSFVDLHIERATSRSVVGSVIKGRVNRVLPGMQAAFVDIGLEKAAFLYVGDYFDDNREPQRGRGRGRGGNSRHTSIEDVLKEGQAIVVQVAKEPIGTKGARITSNLSIAGRHLVLTPWSGRVGVSRRIGGERERRRLRDIVEKLRPKNLGFIIRTAGEAARKADLEADVRYLSSVWDAIDEKKLEEAPPTTLYSEPSLPIRVIRDFANVETKRIVVDSPAVFEEMTNFVTNFVADPKPAIELHESSEPIFRHYGIEGRIDANLERKVWLKSGGYLIIDQTEALTSIDVNTGRFVGKRNLEDTVLKTNLEAVREVAYQLRFRNIGGLIIVDLIDMEPYENREKVYRSLVDALRGDKAKTNVLEISELGLIEMTRKRTRENLVQTLCEPCPYCDGRSFILSCESVAYKTLREIRSRLPRFNGRSIAVTVNPHVAGALLSAEQATLDLLSQELGNEIEIRAKRSMHQGQIEIMALDDGQPLKLEIPWLSEERRKPEEKPAKPRGRGGRGRGKPAAEIPAEASPAAETGPSEGAEIAENASESGDPPVESAASEEVPAVTEPQGEETSTQELAPLEEIEAPEAAAEENEPAESGEPQENALHSAVPNEPEPEVFEFGDSQEESVGEDTDDEDHLPMEPFSEEHTKS